MNIKQLFALLLLSLLSLVAVFFAFSLKKTPSGSGAGGFEDYIPEFDVNSVKKISVKSGDKSFIAVLKNENWIMPSKYNYPADFEKIAAFINEMRNIRPLRTMSEASDGEFEKNGRVDVVFTGNGELPLLMVELGDFHYPPDFKPNPYIKQPLPDGRYVKLSEGSNPYVLTPSDLSYACPFDEAWISGKLFDIQIERIKSVSLLVLDSGKEWEIEASDTGGSFRIRNIPDGFVPRPEKISSVFSSFINPDILDVAPFEKDKLSVIRVLGEIKIEMKSGREYIFKIGTRDGEYFIKADTGVSTDEKDKFYTHWIYKISPDTAKNLLVSKKEITRKLPSGIHRNKREDQNENK